MCEIKISIDNQRNLTVFAVSGDLKSDEILNKLEFCYKSTPNKSILWDLTNGSWANISSRELREIVEKAKEYSRRNQTKIAFVFSKETDLGIGRVLVSFAEFEGFRPGFGCFRRIAEADKWLAAKEAQKSNAQPDNRARIYRGGRSGPVGFCQPLH